MLTALFLLRELIAALRANDSDLFMKRLAEDLRDHR